MMILVTFDSLITQMNHKVSFKFDATTIEQYLQRQPAIVPEPKKLFTEQVRAIRCATFQKKKNQTCQCNQKYFLKKHGIQRSCM